MTTVSSGFIPTSEMLNYAALALVFAAMMIGVPHTVSSLVGGSIGLALAHAFEAAYIAQTIVRPITSGLGGIKKGMEGLAAVMSGKTGPAQQEDSAMQSILRQHQRQNSAEAAANAATKVLNPFDGQPPGYNYRPPNSPTPSPNGPALPPSPNSGPGSGGPALQYQPRPPANYTRHIAVDVTELQNGNGKGSSSDFIPRE